jgi:hypothetical protein
MGMDETLQFDTSPIGRQSALREAIDVFGDHEKLSKKIKQLLNESNDAKNKGQWKKAQDLLFELQKVTKNNSGDGVRLTVVRAQPI